MIREQAPQQTPKLHWRESPHLSFAAQSLSIHGDPETLTDFNRALNYLETITAHFLEFGPLEEKTAYDVAYELSYHNAWYEYEVKQERKHGQSQAEYREINLAHLRALSKRKLLAQVEAGSGNADYRVTRFLDQLIEQAVAEEEAVEKLMTPPPNEL